eukprot:TRINITY_DN7166_c0_g1_i2.p1 TRINITY_DN7166_c0_g1~~TRINITY_DN7166_c0_g1_i2.p1  ORF type:complete len:413 (+),score=53.29 TRINITY_DN7166_c0_g1_i2:164-1402(+)
MMGACGAPGLHTQACIPMYAPLSQQLLDDIHGRGSTHIQPREIPQASRSCKQPPLVPNKFVLTGYQQLHWTAHGKVRLASLEPPAELWVECGWCMKWRCLSERRGFGTALARSDLVLQDALHNVLARGCAGIGTHCNAMQEQPEADVDDMLCGVELLDCRTSIVNRISVWNTVTKRKISGNAAPMSKNLKEYLYAHPECELYTDQDTLLTREEKARLIEIQNRIPIWNKHNRRKICGNAAPSSKNLRKYLEMNKDCEVYLGQDLTTRPLKPESTIGVQACSAGYKALYQIMVDECVNGGRERMQRLAAPAPAENPPEKTQSLTCLPLAFTTALENLGFKDQSAVQCVRKTPQARNSQGSLGSCHREQNSSSQPVGSTPRRKSGVKFRILTDGEWWMAKKSKPSTIPHAPVYL